MITEREVKHLDDMSARLSEHFTDHIIIARTGKGTVSWRSSDPLWAEAATDNYLRYVRMGNHLQMVDDFYRRD